MRYRRLGRTELKVSELALGTVSLGLEYGIAASAQTTRQKDGGLPPPAPAEAIKLIHRAVDAGINLIDTARAYGSSEEIIGRALRGRRQQVILTTKVGCLDKDVQPLQGKALYQAMHDSLTTSLRQLDTDYVDLLLLHSAPVPVLAAGEAVAVLKTFQQQGLTRFIGASTYGIAAPRLAVEQNLVDVLQVAYNVLDQRLADELFSLAADGDIGLVVRSVYLKGALTGRAEDLPERLAPLKAQSRAYRSFVAQLTPPLTAVEAALRFVLSNPAIGAVLVGVRDVAELEMALAAAQSGPLAADVIQRLQAFRWDDAALLDPSTWGIP